MKNSLEKLINIIEKIPLNSNGCKIWNGIKDQNDYAQYSINNKTKRVSRLIYQSTYPGDYKNIVIRHTCDNPLCCNIQHLISGTQKDNINDCILRGRFARGSKMTTAKFTENDVKKIKIRLKKEHTKIIAKDYGVSNTTIAAIKNGRTWKHVEGGCKREDFKTYSRNQRDQRGSKNPIAKLTEEKVIEIKKRLSYGEFARSIAKDFEVDKNTIFSIKQKRSWAWV